MRVLYGVVGEGMGHATRSRVVIEHLLSRGHEVRIVVSGRASAFLGRVFAGRPDVSLHEIHGLHLAFDGPELDLLGTIVGNLKGAPEGLRKNLEVFARVATDGFVPDAVISDFESWAYFFARSQQIPVVSIDNMQVLNRCALPSWATGWRSLDFRIAKAAVKAKLPGAYHYLVTGFFFPDVRKPRTTLVPPILRPEILAARREPGDHVLVYQTAASAGDTLVPILQSLPWQFRVYGLGREGVEKNVAFRPFSETGFVDDLRTARAVLANGGLSLMCEAVHLHVPMLSVPLEGQFEQELNARWLSQLGYGMRTEGLDRDAIGLFLDHVPAYQQALEAYVPRDNGMLFGCVDELLERIARGETRPDVLDAPSMGDWAHHA